MDSFKRVLSYTKKYYKYLLISGITASFYGIFSAAPTYVIKHTVDDIFIKRYDYLLIPFLIIFFSIFALKGLFMYLSNYYMNYVGNKVVNDIRHDLFNKVIHFPISFYREKTTGQLMSHFLNDILMIQNASSSAIKNGVRSFFEAVFLLTVAISQNWKLALLMSFVGPVIAITISKMGKSIKKASVAIQGNMGQISSHLQEVFIGIREIKAFNGEKIESNRFYFHLQNCFKSIMKNVQIDSFAPAFIEAIAMLGSSVVFYVAAKQIMAGTISAGQLTAFFAAILLAYQPLKRLINVYSEIQYGLAAADRIFTLMDQVYPATHLTSDIINNTENKPKTLNSSCEIKFENISFYYSQENPVLTNINLTINKNESIGLIGPSGSGKSTFCDLLLGFITPISGKILINNQDISNMTLAKLRNKIGYVGQKTFLFNDTISSNVSYSQQDKTLDQITNSCLSAHADEFIQKLPNKYNSMVGENGNNLSGGQKQRLTIARALLKDPEILILDEATSSLDTESESMIKLALEELKNKKTIIVISHRLSFIENLDRIFILKDRNLQEISKDNLFKQQEFFV